MSRAPAHEPPAIPMNAALSPFGLIDFAENQGLQAHGVTSGVVGGPPAYLEAHGIRYVPSASLESLADDLNSEASSFKQPAMVSMSRDASSSAPIAVTQRELDSRVDDRIRRFMADSEFRGVSARLRDSEYEVTDKLRALRSELEYPEAIPRRSDRLGSSMLDNDEPVRRSDRLRTSARSSEESELRQLRMQCEAAARRSERALHHKSEMQRLADL
jgi:hypothetical protein